IRAFHHLSSQSSAGGLASTVTAGISEALVATAFGILVAIPAVVAFNLYQRRVRAALTEAEALRSHLTAHLLGAKTK
ncbi:MAG TPA: MotA/TolQ/ExbB proton channel family protein, partial [Bdellovibrionota bacterium]|nr:MotA/TolQ/ExbB proton channel family protein [Bdellovibrionota bacterium]